MPLRAAPLPAVPPCAITNNQQYCSYCGAGRTFCLGAGLQCYVEARLKLGAACSLQGRHWLLHDL